MTMDEGGVEPADAVRYCEQVAFGGYADWRLPTIEELRTLVRGNPATETDGECPLVNDSVSSDMNDPACVPVTEYGGPGTDAGGCYWPPELTGNCNKPDPASKGHPLEYVASTRCPDVRLGAGMARSCLKMALSAGTISIHLPTCAACATAPTPTATCTEEGECMPGETRKCMARISGSAHRSALAEGNCWGPCDSTAFKKSPPRTDVCPSCDQIKLTIRVPEKLAVTARSAHGLSVCCRHLDMAAQQAARWGQFRLPGEESRSLTWTHRLL